MKNVIEFPGLNIYLELPDGFMIGDFKIAFYGMIIAAGLMLAIVYALKKFRKVGVDPDRAIDCIIGGIIGGIVGARLYYVIFSWDSFKDNLWSILDIRSGGLAIYGGLIGGVLVGVLIAKWRKVKILPFLDIIGVAFFIGQGIGRWGNFFNVEAFGSNTTLPWGMTGPNVVNYLTSKMEYLSSVGITVDPTMPVHPCFLYESIWCLIGFIGLNLYLKHRRFDGEVFLMYLAFYGFGRFIIEGLRTDSLMIGNMRVSQVLALILVVVCTIIIIVIRSKIKGNHDDEYLKLFAKTPAGLEIVNGKPETKKTKTVKVTNVDEKISEETAEINVDETAETTNAEEKSTEETAEINVDETTKGE